jgi:phenylacetate-coenzyme A ligase PaaK-like adenylate-forming protein
MLSLNTLKVLYQNSPIWLQELYSKIPFSLRNGSEYRKCYEFLKQEIDIEQYELKKLKETISYAGKYSKYYIELFSKIGLETNDIKSIKDIEAIPFIDKDIIINNFEKLVVANFPDSKKFYVTTGGTSGTPVKFLQSNNIWKKELAFIMDLFGKYGYNATELKASFRGGEFNNLKTNIFWKPNPINNELHFSPFHINKDTIKYYVKEINRVKPLYFHSYPSAVVSIMENMKMRDLKLSFKPKTLFLISENYTQHQVHELTEFFGCKCVSFYGHSERAIFAPCTSESLDTYYIDRRYGFVELIDHNEVIEDNDVRGELVGTSFDNYVMPLVRYRTNDITQYLNYDNKIISKIHGRWNQEYLTGKNNEKITLSALNMHSDIFANIRTFQYYQNEAGEIDFIIVPKNDYTEHDRVLIMRGLRQKASDLINFRLVERKSPLLTNRGKFNLIIKK